MPLALIENDAVSMIRKDVETQAELEAKLGSSVSGVYRTVGDDAAPGMAVSNGKVVIPTYTPPTQAELTAQWREAASLTKQEFCLALRDNSVLNDTDTKIAANGGWPAPFLPALALMNDPVKAEIIWSGATVINRNDPLILVLQSYSLNDPAVIDLTDTLVDSMFGLAP